SRLYPAGFTVVETDVLPDGFDIYGGWRFINGEVKPVPVDYQAKAEETRKKLLNDADNRIRDWRTELTLGTISDENKAVLILWMNYINTLKSLDISNVTTEAKYKAIKWPEVPDVA
ncbi:tail fiber assembly protein, partial [Salmonella enterica]|nr:tail fiber assembly protein [Salmonella enterica]